MKLRVIKLTREGEKTFILDFILLYWPVFEHFSDLRKKNVFFNDLFISIYIYIYMYRERERERSFEKNSIK